MSIVLIFGGLMIGLLIFGTAYKYYEVRKVSGSWLRTRGKVVSAKAVSRRVRTAETRIGAESGGDLNIRNFPEIVYEYHVGAKRYTGNRVTIGEDLGDYGVEETLKRYPVGTEVIVYYNEKKPREAVLEYGAPEGVWRTMIVFISILIALLIGATVGFERVAELVRNTVSQPERAIPVAAFAGMAVFMLLIGIAQRRQVGDAQSWPSVEGIIETSDIDKFRSWERKAHQSSSSGYLSMRWQTYFRPDVAYHYSVNGIEYHSNRISFGGRVYASFDHFARNRIRRYRPGERVVVYYKPGNAVESVLERRAYGEWVIWALMAAFAGGAIWLTGSFM